MIVISSPILKKDIDDFIVSSIIRTRNKDYCVWYKSKNEIKATADTFLISSLLVAMKTGEHLVVEGKVSKRLYDSIDNLQRIYSSWFDGMNKIIVTANVSSEYDHLPVKPSHFYGSFFTAGVDSFYTLLTHYEVSHLVFVHGFDIKLAKTKYRTEISNRIKLVSGWFNRNLIEVETNLREFTDDFCGWDIQFGAGLSSVASILSGIDTMLIPSSGMSLDIKLGSHPELDYMWSTNSVNIMHDGAGILRIDKVNKILTSRIALDNIRVCWSSDTDYNCGHCEKCVRTIIELYASGVILEHQFNAFGSIYEQELESRIFNIRIAGGNDLLFANENINSLKNGIIKSALMSVVDKYHALAI